MPRRGGRGPARSEISEEVKKEAIKLIKLRIPMKYIGTICGISVYFVKRILEEEGLEDEYRTPLPKKSESSESSNISEAESS